MSYYSGFGDTDALFELFDNLDPVTKKMANLTATTREKRAIIDAIGLEKELDMNGFTPGQAHFSDGDSGIYTDAYGQTKKFRLADVNRIDSFDRLNDVNNSPSKKRRQPQLVARLLGKPVESLTADDYDQADRYHAFAIDNLLRNGDILPFNPGVDYRNFRSQPVNLAFKKIGEDKYGRDLVEAINPRTGTSASFDISNSPELNANFDLFNSIKTPKNLQRLEKHEQKYEQYQRLQELRRANRENRIGEDIDMIQSNAYQSFARAIDFLPEGIKNTLGIDSRKWAKIASPEGQFLADKWAGVDPTTREDYTKNTAENLDLIANGKGIGDYAKGILGIVKDFDRLLADSAVQTGLGIAGTALGGGLAGLAGAGNVAKTLLGGLSGGMLAGADETLSNLQDYKAKHGKDMPASEALKLFLGHIPIAAAENLLAVAGLKRMKEALPIGKGKALKELEWSNFGKEAAKSFGKSTAYEGLQENVQQSWGALFQDPNKDISDLFSVMKEPENIYAGIAGAVMGGGLSGINTTLRAGGKLLSENIKSSKPAQEQRSKTRIESQIQESKTNTVSGIDVNPELEKQATLSLKGINDSLKNASKLSDDELANMYSEAEKIENDDTLSEFMNNNAGSMRINVLKELLSRSKDDSVESAVSLLKKFGLTPVEFMEEMSAYSNPDSMDYQATHEELPTEESRQKFFTEISLMGKRLGLDNETIAQTFEKTVNDIEKGKYGFNNYKKNVIRNLSKANNPDIDDETRKKLIDRAQVYFDKITNLGRNQLVKATQFDTAINRIAGKQSNLETIDWESTYGNFDMHAEDLIANDYESGGYSHKLFRDFMDKTGKIGKLLSEIKEADKNDVLDFSSVDELRKNFNPSKIEASYKAAAEKIYKGTAEDMTGEFMITEDSINKDGLENDKIAKGLNIAAKPGNNIAKREVLLELRALPKNALNKLAKQVETGTKIKANRIPVLNLLRSIATESNNNQQSLQTSAQTGTESILHQPAEKKPKQEKKQVKQNAAQGLSSTFTKTPTTVRNAITRAIQESYKFISLFGNKSDKQRQFVPLPKIRKAFSPIISKLPKEKSKKVENFLVAFAKNQVELKDLAGVIHSHYHGKQQVISRQNVLAAIVNSMYNHVVENNMGEDDINSLVEEIANSKGNLYSDTTEDGKPDSSAYLDALIDELQSVVTEDEVSESKSEISERNELSPESDESTGTDYNNLLGALDEALGEQSDSNTNTELEKKPEKKPESKKPEEKPDPEQQPEQQPVGDTDEVTGTDYDALFNALNEAEAEASNSQNEDTVTDTNTEEDEDYDPFDSEAESLRKKGVVPDEDGGNAATIFMSSDEDESSGMSPEDFKTRASKKKINKAQLSMDSVFIRSESERTALERKSYREKIEEYSEILKEEIDEESGTQSESLKATESEYKEYDTPALEVLLNPKRNKFKTFENIGDALFNRFALAFSKTKRKRTLSTLATKGILNDALTKELIASMLTTAKQLKIDPYESIELFKEDESGKKTTVKNFMNLYLGQGGDVTSKKALWKQAPYILMMYNMTEKSGKNIDLSFNNMSLLLMRLATLQYLSTLDFKSFENPTSIARLAEDFGMTENQTDTIDARSAVTYILQNFGIPASNASTRMGQSFLEMAGLIRSNNQHADANIYEKTKEGLGQFGIDVLVAEKKLVRDEVTLERLKSYLDADESVTPELKTAILKYFGDSSFATVKPFKDEFDLPADNSLETNLFLGNLDKQTGLRTGGLADYYNLKTHNVSTGFIVDKDDTKVNLPVATYMKNTNGKAEIPEYARQAMNNVQHTKHKINTSIFKYIFDNDENTKKFMLKMGFVTDDVLENMSKTERDSHIGVNQEIARNINDLRILYEEVTRAGVDARIIFPVFMARNGRINYASNTANPQNNKMTTRFFVLPQDIELEIDINDSSYEKTRRLEAFAVAQAFDAIQQDDVSELKLLDWFDSLSIDDISQMRNDLITMSDDKFKDTYSEKSGFKIGIENIGQVMVILEHFTEKKNSTNGKFTSFLPVEIDSTTSGYFLRLMQMPHESVLPILGKLGVHLGDSRYAHQDMDRTKKSEGYLDVYKFMASKASNGVDSMFEAMETSTDGTAIQEQFAESKIDSDALFKLFERMKGFLPRANADGTISSAFRTLIKAVAIPFGYNSGESSTRKSLTKEIVDEMISYYMKVFSYYNPKEHKTAKDILQAFKNNANVKKDEIAKYESAFDTIQSLNDDKQGISHLRQQLLNNEAWKVFVNIKRKDGKSKVSLEYALSDAVNLTYGKAIWEALDSIFESIRPINRMINISFQNISRVFQDLILQEIDHAYEKSPTGLTVGQIDKIVNNFSNMMPKMPSYFGGEMNFIRTTKATGKNVFKKQNRAMRIEVNRNEDGKVLSQKEAHSYAQGQMYDLTKQAAAVLAIHFTDGMVAQSVLNNISGLTVIHDAFVCSALKMAEVAQAYNYNSYMISMNQDIVMQSYQAFEEAFRKINRDNKKQYVDMPLLDPLGKGLTDTKKISIPIMYEEQFAKELKEAKQENAERWRMEHIFPERIEQLVKKYNELGKGGTFKEIDVTYNLRWKDYLPIARNIAYTNAVDRENLRSQEITVGNTGGLDGNVHITPDDVQTNMLFHEALKKHRIAYSSVDGFADNGEIFDLLHHGIEEEKVRVNAIDKIHKMAKSLKNTVESSKHMVRLKSLMSYLNMKGLGNYEVRYNMLGTKTEGKANIDAKQILLRMYNNTDGQASNKALASMPAASALAHEYVHAPTLAVILNPAEFDAGHQVRELSDLMESWIDNGGSWKDLMPTNYKPELQEYHERNAKKTFNYLVKHKKSGYGLAEFASYATTYEPFVNALEKIEIKVNGKPLTIGQRIYNVVKELFKLFTFNGNITSVLRSFSELKVKKQLPQRSVNLQASIEQAVVAISKANMRAAKKLNEHPLSLGLKIYNVLFNSVRTGNKWLSKTLTEIFDSDKLSKYEWKVEPGEGKISIFSKIFGIAFRAIYDKKARAAFGVWAQNVMNIAQSGTLLTIMRDMAPNGDRTNTLYRLSTLARVFDSAAKLRESIYAQDMIQAFSTNPSTAERAALNNALIVTDAQHLVGNGYSPSQVLKMYKDRNYLLGETHKVSQQIKSMIKSEKLDTYIHNQALSTAIYMVENVGNETTLKNAEMILNTRGIKNDELANLIGKLSTMYAMDMVSKDDIDVLNSMEFKGVKNFLDMHKHFNDIAINGLQLRDTILPVKTTKKINPTDAKDFIKGYSKFVFDSHNQYEINFVSSESDMNKDGYRLVEELPIRNGMPKLAIYEKAFANPGNRDGTAFMIRGSNMFSEAMSSSAYRIAKNVEPDVTSKEFVSTRNNYMKTLNDTRKKHIEKMESRILTADEIRNMSSGFTPVFRENKKGNLVVSDYQIAIPTKFRKETINDNMDGIEILSKMFASQYTSAHANIQNERLISFLLEDMQKHMKKDFTDDETGIKYIKFTDSEIRKYMDDDDMMIPKSIIQMGESVNLYVREDWLINLFGSKGVSASEAPVIEKVLPPFAKQAVRMVEYSMKMTASLVKTNILFKKPAVLIGNIISNMMYSFMNGANPIRVMKMTFDNLIHTHEYMKTRKELATLLMKKDLHKATKSEINKIEILQERLKANPVASIIQYGFLQDIIEDASSNDMKNLKKITQKITNSRVYEMIPDVVKKGIKWMYMPEGTPVYDLMANLTQISDFASRVTEYQLRMEKAPSKFIKHKNIDGEYEMIPNDEYDKYKDRLINELWEAFVNYDVPQSSLMQYLNDTGITMFTKYGFRIQKAIRSSLFRNPIGAIMFLLTGSMIDYGDNIMEQNIFQKHWSSLFHNPLMNYVEAIVPMPAQYLTGMTKF